MHTSHDCLLRVTAESLKTSITAIPAVPNRTSDIIITWPRIPYSTSEQDAAFAQEAETGSVLGANALRGQFRVTNQPVARAVGLWEETPRHAASTQRPRPPAADPPPSLYKSSETLALLTCLSQRRLPQKPSVSSDLCTELEVTMKVKRHKSRRSFLVSRQIFRTDARCKQHIAGKKNQTVALFFFFFFFF